MAAVKNHLGERKFRIVSVEKPYQWDPLAAIVSEHRAEMQEKLSEAQKRKQGFFYNLKKVLSLRRR
ncbi:MAG: hypothetical protein HYW05_01285 [Candidatus Diapherotrites archaeon]|nr:hypothetical protein [Candidatus Diapherotrites archaeon]